MIIIDSTTRYDMAAKTPVARHQVVSVVRKDSLKAHFDLTLRLVREPWPRS